MSFSHATPTVCSDPNEFSVLESIDRKKERHVISVEEYTDVIENLLYSVDKPYEAKWS
jgi:hypothetical protein